jgi:hypothetical protein
MACNKNYTVKNIGGQGGAHNVNATGSMMKQVQLSLQLAT